ncbi:phytanoyl-CoA dioxygenase family protein [Diaphorobacter caeni]|uniref:phytanoyl-CoA dioxygenase family protein n=1 Tax=Diaphorobacter caeni TaxID=2784387 RepID=UPI00188F1E22|nr:phytanoyl-CoA dioxygenase family protein [Diaphorobacter caeni]MBF5007769.1 phytanoyl-CoA dioxygenase family protein [Diaphorobacter caeni]
MSIKAKVSNIRRWTLVGDIGGAANFHAGDEAMLESNLRLLRSVAPGSQLHVISADPEFTSLSYGVQAFARLGFDDCATEIEREALLDQVSRPHWTSRAPKAFGALADASDGLLISGGGNLRDAWPACIYERLALCRRAVKIGASVVILGQTIGPELNDRHREMVSEMLRAASWIGVREYPSYQRALTLGADPRRMSFQIDDAHALGRADPGSGAGLSWPLSFPIQSPWIGVTFHPLCDPAEGDPVIESLARQLEAFALHAGCELVFISHARAAPKAGARWSDEDMGKALAACLRKVVMHVLPVLPAAQIARMTAQARLVVSSRYHPLVFALAADVPCVGVCVDDYTRTKLQGALLHMDCAGDVLDLSSVLHGHLITRLMHQWAQREARSAHIALQRPSLERDESLRREALARMFCTGMPVEPPVPARWSGIAASMLDSTAPVKTDARPLAQTRRHVNSEEGRSKMVSEIDWQQFERDGYLYLGQVLSADEVKALQQRADTLALGELDNPHIQMQRDTGGEYDALPDAVARFEEGSLLYRKIQGLENDDRFAQLIDRPVFREICARMYGAHSPVSIFRAMIMNKPAGLGTNLPWHQDGGTVWQLDRDPLVTIWVALDDATQANGCMDAIRGSHRNGLLSMQGSTLTHDQVQEHCHAEQIVALEVPSGHAVLMHNWLIHRSGVNPSSAPRRAFTMCCMDARTRSLQTGARFPIVYGALTDEPDHYVQQLHVDLAATTAMASEAERYALSLRDAHADAERYARSLEAELASSDLNERNRRMEQALVQMRMEMQELNRALATAKEGALDEVHRLDARIRSMEDSMSWRVTQPLRAVLKALRGW